MAKKYLTTGQIAKLLECSPRTVAQYIDSGRLRGHRLPPGKSPRSPGMRRASRADVDRFARDNGFAIDNPQPAAGEPADFSI